MPLLGVLRACAWRGVSFSSVHARAEGRAGSAGYRILFEDAAGRAVSPWHEVDLSLASRGAVPFVCEIPLGTTAKYEVSKGLPQNPIVQDRKKGKLRHYPFASLVNYGCVPQTWEDPAVERGDDDPLDILSLEESVTPSGSVAAARVLGCLHMIDEGETDWKLLAYPLDSAGECPYRDIRDFMEASPGRVEQIVTWFKSYKVADGKAPGVFLNGEKPLEADAAWEIVESMHASWRALVASPAHPEGFWFP